VSLHALTRLWALMMLAAVVHAQDATGHQPLFTPCAQALATREFAPLRGVIPEELRESAGCLRLDNAEFLLFSQPDGPGKPFRYCDLHAAVHECKEEPNWFYDFRNLRQFTGSGGKRYMLWFTWQMKRGVYDDGYGIFSLVPKAVEPRGFDIYSLTGGSLFKGEGDGADPCYEIGRDEVSEITGYELLGEGTADVELRFTKKIIECATKKESLRMERFRPKDGKFELVRD
jgi:hypothetical protein